MSYPTDFSTAAFAIVHGTDALNRAMTYAEQLTSDIIDHNEMIGAVLRRAIAEIKEIGEPDRYLARGYDYSDALMLLEDITPDTSPAGRDGLADWAMDVAREAI
jgi:hypothetical protein